MTDECDQTHPGFTITCDHCKSTDVYVENTQGFSATSGGWGSVNLVCQGCKRQVEIATNY